MSNTKKPPANSHPYGRASGSYGAQAKKHAGKRDVEAQVLLKAARKMQELQNGWDQKTPASIEETIRFNRQIWVMFYDNAINSQTGQKPPEPQSLKANIVNLAGFVFKRSMDILADPEREKLNILININREVAAGLMTKPVTSQPA